MVDARGMRAGSGVEGGQLEQDVVLFWVSRVTERDRGGG